MSLKDAVRVWGQREGRLAETHYHPTAIRGYDAYCRRQQSIWGELAEDAEVNRQWVQRSRQNEATRRA